MTVKWTLPILVVGALQAGCMGDASLDERSPAIGDRYAPCTDAVKCCSKDDIKCTGDPDSTFICTCSSLWDCSKNPKKCEQPIPAPAGGGNWSCTWSEAQYVCKQLPPGGKPPTGTPPGGPGWTCVQGADKLFTCTHTPPNPSNKPDGGNAWTCQVDKEFGKLTCEKKDTPTTPPDTTPGTPPTPPSGTTPPTTPPSTTPPPPSGGKKECVPGEKMWCDGLQYCGWGQVICDPNGFWKRKGFLGLGGLDCQELTDGTRPNTPCACFFTFFNPKCCETPDCIVPAGSSGQICAPSAGKLCDYCTPGKPSCAAGQCVILSSGETFCGQTCSAGTPCPAGYQCTQVGSSSGSSYQCVPAKLSCFF